jgi:hypothetical protein
MDKPIEEHKIDGYTLKIFFDPEPLDPRKENDCYLGKMRCWHRRYSLGDDAKRQNEDLPDDPKGFREALEARDAVFLSLYLYDHSGTTMSTGPFSCPWDSGQVGYIYAMPDRIKEEYTVTEITADVRERVVKCLEAEVQAYDRYLTGQIFGFVIEDGEGEHVDSCWGFDDLEYMKDEATGIIKHLVDKASCEEELRVANQAAGGD